MDPCEVCFDEPPVHQPFIPCDHSNSFCEGCVKQLRAFGRRNCPKCRAIWPIPRYRFDFINIPPPMAYSTLAIIENVYFPPPTTITDGLGATIFKCFSIGVLLGLIIYPAVKQP